MAGLPSGRGKRGSVPFRGMKSAGRILEGAETVTGSYRTPSGTSGGAVHGSRTVPTASGRGATRPGDGKGLTLLLLTLERPFHGPKLPNMVFLRLATLADLIVTVVIVGTV